MKVMRRWEKKADGWWRCVDDDRVVSPREMMRMLESRAEHPPTMFDMVVFDSFWVEEETSTNPGAGFTEQIDPTHTISPEATMLHYREGDEDARVVRMMLPAQTQALKRDMEREETDEYRHDEDCPFFDEERCVRETLHEVCNRICRDGSFARTIVMSALEGEGATLEAVVRRVLEDVLPSMVAKIRIKPGFTWVSLIGRDIE